MGEVRRLPANARARLLAMRREADRKRGRPLTDTERVANLRHALDRVCWDCGADVEPGARCPCGTVNARQPTV